MDATAFIQFYLCVLILLAGCLSSVEGQVNVNILPISAAVGAPHVFQLFGRTAFTALVAMIGRHYGIGVERVTLIFGGRILEGLRRLSDIPGLQNGFTIHLHVRAVGARTIAPTIAPGGNEEAAAAARRAHDVNWGRIRDLVIGQPPHNNPNMPNHHERNYILTVATILAFGINGIVNITGLPGEDDFDVNVLLAIMYYYERKGWPSLQQQFVNAVYDNM